MCLVPHGVLYTHYLTSPSQQPRVANDITPFYRWENRGLRRFRNWSWDNKNMRSWGMSQGPGPSIPPGNNVSYQPPASSDQALPWSPWAISVSSIALIVNHELPAIAQPLFSWNTKCFLYLGICVSSFQQAYKLLEGIYLCLNTMLSAYKKTYQLCLDFFLQVPSMAKCRLQSRNLDSSGSSSVFSHCRNT